jgi:hypothetical protein
MSKIKSCLYLIEYKNGDDPETMNEFMLKSIADNIFDNISKIVKQYRLQDNPKKIYNMILFTDEYTISASDYVEHYRNLQKDIYGYKVLSDFDIEIIYMFN